jgi:hypothetical protein
VRRARRDDEDVSGPRGALLARDPEGRRPGEDLEPLLLLRVNVGGGDEATRAEDEIELQQLAVGVGGGLQERESFAGDRVLERLAGAGHDRAHLLERLPSSAKRTFILSLPSLFSRNHGCDV